MGISAKKREAIGLEIIAYIQERTAQDQVDKNGKKLASYTKEYAEKKGVSRGDVDLMDTGDMLMSLTLLTHRSGSITIGYPAGDPINGKVEGNRLGTYGQQTPIPGKARDFLGLTDEELVDIFARVITEEDINANEAYLEQMVEDNAGNLSDEELERLSRMFD